MFKGLGKKKIKRRRVLLKITRDSNVSVHQQSLTGAFMPHLGLLLCCRGRRERLRQRRCGLKAKNTYSLAQYRESFPLKNRRTNKHKCLKKLPSAGLCDAEPGLRRILQVCRSPVMICPTAVPANLPVHLPPSVHSPVFAPVCECDNTGPNFWPTTNRLAYWVSKWMDGTISLVHQQHRTTAFYKMQVDTQPSFRSTVTAILINTGASVQVSGERNI